MTFILLITFITISVFGDYIYKLLVALKILLNTDEKLNGDHDVNEDLPNYF